MTLIPDSSTITSYLSLSGAGSTSSLSLDASSVSIQNSGSTASSNDTVLIASSTSQLIQQSNELGATQDQIDDLLNGLTSVQDILSEIRSKAESVIDGTITNLSIQATFDQITALALELNTATQALDTPRLTSTPDSTITPTEPSSSEASTPSSSTPSSGRDTSLNFVSFSPSVSLKQGGSSEITSVSVRSLPSAATSSPKLTAGRYTVNVEYNASNSTATASLVNSANQTVALAKPVEFDESGSATLDFSQGLQVDITQSENTSASATIDYDPEGTASLTFNGQPLNAESSPQELAAFSDHLAQALNQTQSEIAGLKQTSSEIDRLENNLINGLLGESTQTTSSLENDPAQNGSQILEQTRNAIIQNAASLLSNNVNSPQAVYNLF